MIKLVAGMSKLFAALLSYLRIILLDHQNIFAGILKIMNNASHIH